jgi:hypothetical protein
MKVLNVWPQRRVTEQQRITHNVKRKSMSEAQITGHTGDVTYRRENLEWKFWFDELRQYVNTQTFKSKLQLRRLHAL